MSTQDNRQTRRQTRRQTGRQNRFLSFQKRADSKTCERLLQNIGKLWFKLAKQEDDRVDKELLHSATLCCQALENLVNTTQIYADEIIKDGAENARRIRKTLEDISFKDIPLLIGDSATKILRHYSSAYNRRCVGRCLKAFESALLDLSQDESKSSTSSSTSSSLDAILP